MKNFYESFIAKQGHLRGCYVVPWAVALVGNCLVGNCPVGSCLLAVVQIAVVLFAIVLVGSCPVGSCRTGYSHSKVNILETLLSM